MPEFRFNPESFVCALLPESGHVHKIYPRSKAPEGVEDFPFLDRPLRTQDRVYFFAAGNWYEMCCLRGG